MTTPIEFQPDSRAIVSQTLATVIDIAMDDLPRTPEREKFLSTLSSWQLVVSGYLDRVLDKS